MFNLVRRASGVAGSRCQVSVSFFKRNISQIKIYPPKVPKEDAPGLAKVDVIYMVMLNVAAIMAIVGALQSEGFKDSTFSVLMKSIVNRYLSQPLESRDPEFVKQCMEVVSKGVSTDAAPQIMDPVTQSEIVVISSLQGCGTSCALVASAASRKGVCWIDFKRDNNLGGIIMRGIAGESHNVLRVEPLMRALPDLLNNYAASAGDEGLVIVIDHSSIAEDSLAFMTRGLVNDLATLIQKNNIAALKDGKPAPKIRLVLVDPSLEVCRAAVSVKGVKIRAVSHRGEPVDKIQTMLLKKYEDVNHHTELGNKINIENALKTCGPDLRCIEETHAQDIQKLQTRLQNASDEVQRCLLSARDPRTQLAQILILDSIRESKTISPPELVELSELRDAVEAQLLKLVPQKKIGDMITLRRLVDTAIERLEHHGVLWRCTDDGLALPNAAATHMCVKKMSTVRAWEVLRSEQWLLDSKQACISTISK